MKVTLLLLACLVGVSYAQRYIWPMPYAPRAHLLPLFYADGKPAHFENLPQVQELDNQAKTDAVVVSDQQEGKFLLGLGIASGISSAVSNFKPFTTTTTLVGTVTTTVSKSSTAACIALSVFAVNTSTAACARRRREIEEPFALFESTKENIQPAQPLALEVTAIETLPLAKEAPTVESSQIIPAQPSGISEERILLSGLNLTSTVTATSLTTVTSLVISTIKSTANVAGSGVLSCLPAGYVVC